MSLSSCRWLMKSKGLRLACLALSLVMVSSLLMVMRHRKSRVIPQAHEARTVWSSDGRSPHGCASVAGAAGQRAEGRGYRSAVRARTPLIPCSRCSGPRATVRWLRSLSGRERRWCSGRRPARRSGGAGAVEEGVRHHRRPRGHDRRSGAAGRWCTAVPVRGRGAEAVGGRGLDGLVAVREGARLDRDGRRPGALLRRHGRRPDGHRDHLLEAGLRLRQRRRAAGSEARCRRELRGRISAGVSRRAPGAVRRGRETRCRARPPTPPARTSGTR